MLFSAPKSHKCSTKGSPAVEAIYGPSKCVCGATPCCSLRVVTETLSPRELRAIPYTCQTLSDLKLFFEEKCYHTHGFAIFC